MLWRRKRSALAAARRSEEDDAARSQNRSQVRFALTFIVVAIVLFSLYSFPYQERGISEHWFHSYLSGYAHLAGSVLWVFDRAVQVKGTVIDGRFSLNIVKSCDAMEANLLFLAAITAWPARWRRKLVAATVGVSMLVVVNVIRICSLYAVGIHFPSAFEFFHIELWPLLIIGAAIADFLGWAIWMRPPAAAATQE